MSTEQSQLSFERLFGGVPAQPPLPAENYLPPRSRTVDPVSSKRAEAEAKRTGVMRGQRVIVQGLIERYPGRTSKQLADAPESGLDRYQIARRCRELVSMGLVRRPEDEADYVKGQELRWWPKEV